MRKQFLNLLIVLIILLLFFPLFSISIEQKEIPAIVGKVSYPDRGWLSGLPGALITIQGPTITPRSEISDKDGIFRFFDLPTGEYSIKVDFVGFKKIIIRGIIVQAKVPEYIKIELEMGLTEEEIVTLLLPPPKKLSRELHSEIDKIIEEEITTYDEEEDDETYFDPPTTLTEYIKGMIEFRFPSLLHEELIYFMREKGIPHVEQIPISAVMIAKLSGKEFEIKPLSKTKQMDLSPEDTQWKWEVIPKKSGYRKLQLSVSVLFYVNRLKKKEKSLLVVEKDIYVKLNPDIRKTDWLKIIGGIGALLGIIVTLLTIYSKIRKYKSAKRKKGE